MPNYKKMYIELFNSITKVIELLQQAQLTTEEEFVSGEENDGE